MFAQNKWHSALQPGRRYSKKGLSQRIKTDWTTIFGQWWSFDKSYPLHSLKTTKPKWFAQLAKFIYIWNPWQSITRPNFPHVLIIHVKIPALRFFFYFVMEKIVYDYYMLSQKILWKHLFCGYFPFCDRKQFICDYL